MRAAERAVWEECLAIRCGEKQQALVYRVFLDWLKTAHGITGYHAGLDAAPDREFTSPYLIVVIESDRDRELWYDLPLRKPLANRFIEILAEHPEGGEGHPAYRPEELVKLSPFPIVFQTTAFELAMQRWKEAEPDFEGAITAMFAEHVSSIFEYSSQTYTVVYRTGELSLRAGREGVHEAIAAEFRARFRSHDETGTLGGEEFRFMYEDEEDLARRFSNPFHYFR